MDANEKNTIVGSQVVTRIKIDVNYPNFPSKYVYLDETRFGGIVFVVDNGGFEGSNDEIKVCFNPKTEEIEVSSRYNIIDIRPKAGNSVRIVSGKR